MFHKLQAAPTELFHYYGILCYKQAAPNGAKTGLNDYVESNIFMLEKIPKIPLII